MSCASAAKSGWRRWGRPRSPVQSDRSRISTRLRIWQRRPVVSDTASEADKPDRGTVEENDEGDAFTDVGRRQRAKYVRRSTAARHLLFAGDFRHTNSCGTETASFVSRGFRHSLVAYRCASWTRRQQGRHSRCGCGPHAVPCGGRGRLALDCGLGRCGRGRLLTARRSSI